MTNSQQLTIITINHSYPAQRNPPALVIHMTSTGGSTVAFAQLVKKLYVAEHAPSWTAEAESDQVKEVEMR